MFVTVPSLKVALSLFLDTTSSSIDKPKRSLSQTPGTSLRFSVKSGAPKYVRQSSRTFRTRVCTRELFAQEPQHLQGGGGLSKNISICGRSSQPRPPLLPCTLRRPSRPRPWGPPPCLPPCRTCRATAVLEAAADGWNCRSAAGGPIACQTTSSALPQRPGREPRGAGQRGRTAAGERWGRGGRRPLRLPPLLLAATTRRRHLPTTTTSRPSICSPSHSGQMEITRLWPRMGGAGAGPSFSKDRGQSYRPCGGMRYEHVSPSVV